MRHILELLVFLICTAPLAVLPYRLSIKAGEFLGLLCYYLWGTRRRIAMDNIHGALKRGALDATASPEKIARRTFLNMGTYLAEIAKIYYGLGDSIVGGIRFEGVEHYEKAREKGKGVIIVSGHCSNWELSALSFSSRVGKLHGVARRQSNPYVNDFIVRTREKYGSSIIYKEGALKKFISILKGGGTVGVLMDQAVLPAEGVLIEFLGAPAWTTRLPVAVARRTGAALVPVFIERTNGGYLFRIHPEVELRGDDAEDTQRLSAYIEGYIRKNPAQWLWIHRRWKRASAVENGQA